MGTLKAKVGANWIEVLGGPPGPPGPVGPDAMHVGANEPADASIELWYDTDAPPVAGEAVPADAAIGGGIASLDRRYLLGSLAPVSGRTVLSYLTCPRTMTVAMMHTRVGSAAGAGLTLARMGIYSEDAGTGLLTLLAGTANDPAMFGTINGATDKALTTPVMLIAGARYAFAFLAIGTTTPALLITMNQAGSFNELLLTPRLAGAVGGCVDLPATITAAQVNVAHYGIYLVGLP